MSDSEWYEHAPSNVAPALDMPPPKWAFYSKTIQSVIAMGVIFALDQFFGIDPDKVNDNIQTLLDAIFNVGYLVFMTRAALGRTTAEQPLRWLPKGDTPRSTATLRGNYG